MGVDNPSNFKRALPEFAADPKVSGGDQPFVQGPGYQRVSDSNIGQSLIAAGAAIGSIAAGRAREEQEKQKEEQRIATEMDKSRYASKYLQGYQTLQNELPNLIKGMSPEEGRNYGVEALEKYDQKFRETELAKGVPQSNLPDISNHLQLLKDKLSVQHQEKVFNDVSTISTIRVQEAASDLFGEVGRNLADPNSDMFQQMNIFIQGYEGAASGIDWSAMSPQEQARAREGHLKQRTDLFEIALTARLQAAEADGKLNLNSIANTQKLLNDPRTKAVLDPVSHIKLTERINNKIQEYSRAVASEHREQVKADLDSVKEAFKNGTATPLHTQWFLDNQQHLTTLQRRELQVLAENSARTKEFTEEYLAASPSERARMEAAIMAENKPSSGDVTNLQLLSPVVGGSPNYDKPHNHSKNTKAVDLNASDGVVAGMPVRTSAAGTVVASGYTPANGNYYTVEYTLGGSKYTAHYLHLEAKPKLSAGEAVEAGQIIGNVGSTGKSTGPHLHFQIEKDGVPIKVSEFMSGKYQGVDTTAAAKREMWNNVISKAREQAAEIAKNPRAYYGARTGLQGSALSKAILSAGLTDIADKPQLEEWQKAGDYATQSGDPTALNKVLDEISQTVGPEYTKIVLDQMSDFGEKGAFSGKALAAMQEMDNSRRAGNQAMSQASLAASQMDSDTYEQKKTLHDADNGLKKLVYADPMLNTVFKSRPGASRQLANLPAAAMNQAYKTILLLKQEGLSNDQAVQKYKDSMLPYKMANAGSYGNLVVGKEFLDKFQQKYPAVRVGDRIKWEMDQRLLNPKWFTENVAHRTDVTWDDRSIRMVARNAKVRLTGDGQALEVYTPIAGGTEQVWRHRGTGKALRIPLTQLLQNPTARYVSDQEKFGQTKTSSILGTVK